MYPIRRFFERLRYFEDKVKGTPRYVRIFICVFSLFYVIGYALDNVGKIPVLSLGIIPMSIVFIGIYNICLYTIYILSVLWNFAEPFAKRMGNHLISMSYKKMMLFILIVQLPVALIRYPAGIEWDAYHQIEQVILGTLSSSHWPPASSVFMGGFALLGKRLFNSYEMGLFLFVVVQVLLVSLVITYCLRVLIRLHISTSVLFVVEIVFLLSPYIISFSTQIVKDTPFAYAVLFMTALLTEELYGLNFNWSHKIALTVVSIIACISRNNGIYLIAGLIIALMIKSLSGINHRRYLAVTLCLCVSAMMYLAYTEILLPSLNIQKGSVAEALSIPFQQTARYVSEYPEDVTIEEKTIIDNVLEYDKLKELYNPLLSDPVKGTYKKEEKQLAPYFEVWFRHFLKHPLLYVESVMCNSIGFYYPAKKMEDSMPVSFYKVTMWDGGLVEFQETTGIFKYPRLALNAIYKVIGNLPFFYYLCNTAINIWVIVFLTVYEIRFKRFSNVILLLPSVIGILVCIAAPTYIHNGARYAAPIIFSVPYLTGISSIRTVEIDKEVG